MLAQRDIPASLHGAEVIRRIEDQHVHSARLMSARSEERFRGVEGIRNEEQLYYRINLVPGVPAAALAETIAEPRIKILSVVLVKPERSICPSSLRRHKILASALVVRSRGYCCAVRIPSDSSPSPSFRARPSRFGSRRPGHFWESFNG